MSILVSQLALPFCTPLWSSFGYNSQHLIYPDNIAENQDVCWLITSDDKYVRISFPSLSTENGREFVRVYGGKSINSPLLLEASGQYAGDTAGDYWLTAVSSTYQMIVTLNKVSAFTIYAGYFEYSSCTVLTKYSGSISSPNYPKNYNNMDSVIQLTFNNLVTEKYSDFVRVFDGDSTHSPVLWSASGRIAHRIEFSTSNTMLVVFTSNADNTDHGFQAS